MAPPLKITPEIVAALECTISKGAFDEDACLVAGIHRSTLTDWRRKAERGIEPFASAVARLDAARAVVTAAALEKMRAHEDWRASSEWLAKTQPHRYATQQRIVIEREVGESRANFLATAREVLGPQFPQFAREMVKRLGGGDESGDTADVIDVESEPSGNS